jgi:DNA-binding GntR family transcriptional regulator
MPPSRRPRDAAALPVKLGALGDVRRQTAHQLVHEQLRLAILGGKLAPGTPLVLSDLSEQLGTSRTPIREAIRDLATEGLVDFDAYRSPVVHVPTLTEAREIYELRLVLEPLGIKTAMPTLTEEDFDTAQSLHEQMIEVTGNVGEWVELNRQFHAIFTNVVASSRLRSVIASLRDAAAVQVAQSIWMTRDRMETGNVEHARILGAYRARDVDAAAEETQVHLQTTLQVIEDYYVDRLQGQG